MNIRKSLFRTYSSQEVHFSDVVKLEYSENARISSIFEFECSKFVSIRNRSNTEDYVKAELYSIA